MKKFPTLVWFSRYVALFLFTLLLFACGGGSTKSAAKYSKLKAYQSSAYSDILKKCVTISSVSNSCTMRELPLLGQMTNSPSDKDILDRLIVSHKWMGDNFKQVLSLMPDDMKLLFRSTTAIVIDEAIRPSYYWTGTGAIYLDPANLWLMNNEKGNIIKGDDFRSSFGNKLSFKEFRVYTNDGVKAFNTSGKLNNKIERTLDDMRFPLMRLLFHELAHANDMASIRYMKNVDRNDTIFKAIRNNINMGNTISRKLHNSHPLTSTELYSLARVRFKGNTPTEAEKGMKADYVGALFSNEGAIIHYSYSSYSEDVAVLFEAGMMKFHFDIDIDQAIVSYPKNKVNKVCSDYVVGAGSRNKIAGNYAKKRMLTVLEYIFPGRTYSNVQDWVGKETLKVAGKSWCENLASSKSLSKSTRSQGHSSNDKNIMNMEELTILPNQSLSRRGN